MANEMMTGGVHAASEPGPVDDSAVPGYVPDGWKTAQEFIDHVVGEYKDDAAYDRRNREMAMEDLKFLAGEQWDDEVRAAREDMGRPCMTINVLPQFVGQVIGDRRANKTSIKVAPKKDGSTEEAEARSGIIKGIEAQSRADRVYNATCEDQVACGIGNMRVDLEYAANDVFDQDIVIRHIPNPLAVVWDRMHIDPTGRDARHCFVQDVLPRNVYDKQFPDHPTPAELGEQSLNGTLDAGWFDKDVVRICEFWEMIRKPAKFALMQDGDIKDVTDLLPEEYEAELWRDPLTGAPRVRDSHRSYARMHLITGFAILSEAYEVPLDRLPIIKAEGRVIRVGEDRVRFGLVRYAKDSQRLKNYWRSVAAETLALAPKAQWVASDDAVEGREDDWRTAHQSGDPLLIYNKNATGAPTRVDPPNVPAALLQEAQMNQQDIKDTTGIHDASLGMRSNEISGRAIMARQNEGDVATITYHDNLNAAILEVGDVVNQLLPIAFDNVRIALTIGEDDERKLMKINDPNDANSPAISKSRYDVSLETGPSFATQRAEAREAMTTLVQTAPQLFEIAGDLLVKNMDWPGAFEISERLRAMMEKNGVIPPEQTEEGGEPSEEEMMAAQAQQQQTQMMEQQVQLQQQMQQMELQKQQLELQKQQMELERQALELAGVQANNRRAQADAERAEAQADAARYEAEVKRIEAAAAPAERAQKMHLAERAASAKSNTQERGAGNKPRRRAPKKDQPK